MRVQLIEVDDYEPALYVNGKCISNAYWDDASSLLSVLCRHIGIEFDSKWVEFERDLERYLPDSRTYPEQTCSRCFSIDNLAMSDGEIRCEKCDGLD